MPFDATPSAPSRPSLSALHDTRVAQYTAQYGVAFTERHAEFLSAERRGLFAMDAHAEGRERARLALEVTGGDKLAALVVMLGRSS